MLCGVVPKAPARWHNLGIRRHPLNCFYIPYTTAPVRDLHRPDLHFHIHFVGPAVVELLDLLHDIGGQRLDLLRRGQELLQVLQAARRADRGAYLGEAVRKADAELGPVLHAGALENGHHFGGALLVDRTRRWALTKPTSSQENCLKTRRVPPPCPDATRESGVPPHDGSVMFYGITVASSKNAVLGGVLTGKCYQVRRRT